MPVPEMSRAALCAMRFRFAALVYTCACHHRPTTALSHGNYHDRTGRRPQDHAQGARLRLMQRQQKTTLREMRESAYPAHRLLRRLSWLRSPGLKPPT
jgi:hypothetical protein